MIVNVHSFSVLPVLYEGQLHRNRNKIFELRHYLDDEHEHGTTS